MMCKIENCYCKSPISYPENCYADTVEDKDKILVSKKQYENIISEIRAWENNVHLELNIGSYFKIINK